MKIKYQDINLRTKARTMIDQANAIIEEFQAAGYSMTLRQLYYQLVSRDLLANRIENYDRLGKTISDGRRAGLVDWDAIVDRTRFLRRKPTWDSPADIIQSCASQFRLDLWSSQPCYVEIWFEKDALLGVFERSAEAYRLPLCSNRGYMSDSTIWEAAQRIREVMSNLFDGERKRAIILHFGDHDPSGIDMTRDLEERFALFGANPEVRRIALNMGQVRKYKCPPNPAKETDSRYGDYRAKYGDESWELDALQPDVMVKLVESEVRKLINLPKWEDQLGEELKARDQLRAISVNYDKVARFASKLKRKS